MYGKYEVHSHLDFILNRLRYQPFYNVHIQLTHIMTNLCNIKYFPNIIFKVIFYLQFLLKCFGIWDRLINRVFKIHIRSFQVDYISRQWVISFSRFNVRQSCKNVREKYLNLFLISWRMKMIFQNYYRLINHLF